MSCRRLTLALSAAVIALLVGAAVVPAQAAVVTDPRGAATSAQDTFDHLLRISGWAYDRNHPDASVAVRFYADGRAVGHITADLPSPTLDRVEHIGGRHGFVVTINYAATVRSVVIRSSGASSTAPIRTLAASRTTHFQPPAGTRIVTVARRYVGKARYVEGGSSPRTGFDCSGYSAYAYAVAHVATLPHNAEAQRHVRGMHHVSAARAVAGDLVFYFDGGPAYHVAIYAGHGMQYAAATPQDGIRYQRVWSSSVQYEHYSV